ncbi:MAG: hypothetical protein OXK17_06450 [Thaumarchaeota archaeon]|nr:hypothetical protein [Nitrososphaerota archaeon]
MVFSEKAPEDMKKLKSGVLGVVILLVLGSLSPTIIQEFTGVDLETLCGKGETPPAGATDCLDTSGDISKQVFKALGSVPIVVAVIAFVGFAIVGGKY